MALRAHARGGPEQQADGPLRQRLVKCSGPALCGTGIIGCLALDGSVRRALPLARTANHGTRPGSFTGATMAPREPRWVRDPGGTGCRRADR